MFVSNILETCPPKSLLNIGIEGNTIPCSAGHRQPRFSFYIFNCQRTDANRFTSLAVLLGNPANRNSNKCYILNDFARANEFIASGEPPSL